MTILHWDDKTREAIFSIVNLLFCCGVDVHLEHTYEENDMVRMSFFKRQWYVGLKTDECFMVHTTLGDGMQVVEERENFNSIRDMELYIKMVFLVPRTIADLRLMVSDMQFNEVQDFYDSLPDDTIVTLQEEARTIIPNFPTYEDFKNRRRKDFGDAHCFVAGCEERAVYPVSGYGMCEKHSGIKRDYLFDLAYKTRPQTPKPLVYGGPHGNAPV